MIRTIAVFTAMYLALAGILVAAFYYCNGADAKVIKKILQRGHRNDIVEVLSAEDNQNGTQTVKIRACGTLFSVTADNTEISEDNGEFREAVLGTIDMLCATHPAGEAKK